MRISCHHTLGILPQAVVVPSARTKDDFTAILAAVQHGLILPLQLSGKEETIALEPGYIFVFKNQTVWSDGVKWGGYLCSLLYS